MSQFIRKYWPSLIVACVIIYATWLPGSFQPDDLPKFPHFDKLIHAVMFGGFTGALIFDNRRSGIEITRKLLERVGMIAITCGAVDELVQGLLPIGRPWDRLDFLADLAGIVVAIYLAPPVVKAIFKNK